MSGFRNPAVDGPVRRDFERVGGSDIPNDIPAIVKWPVYTRHRRTAWALIEQADVALVERCLWRLHQQGYAWTYDREKGQKQGVGMHRIVAGLDGDDPLEVDHINGDRLDNRRENLRVVTHAENLQNTPARFKTSRYRGVSWNRRTRRWTAQGKVDGRGYYLGQYEDELEAARVAAAWRAEHLPHTNSARDATPLAEENNQKEAA